MAISKKFITIPCMRHNKELNQNGKGLTTGIQERWWTGTFLGMQIQNIQENKHEDEGNG